VTGNPTRAWRDAEGAARLARLLLFVEVGLYAGAVVLGLLVPPGDKALEAPIALFGLVQFVGFAAAAIAVLRWIYLADNNARALGAEDLSGSPGWAVGWFFVPLANLIMPYTTVRDMWKASVNPKDWQAENGESLVILWWACWLISQISGTIAFRLELEMGYEAGEATRMLGLASDLVSIPSALLLAVIIGRIQAQQVQTRPVAILAA